ncbi:MAG: hypothetical protein HN337_00615, partial [Deltaproteobacteria bacterium]|nr:hypothetical protein [Deltaproteobacteria bacterium]
NSALYDKFASRAISTSWPRDIALYWKSTSPLGPGEGHADPYGATNNAEAVATFVQYVYDNGELPYSSSDFRHNQMVINYARLLRDRVFIRADHPALDNI